MLTKVRQEEIVTIVNSKSSVTVQELKEYFKTSESTIRRDITALDENGRITKVFGGAIAKENIISTEEDLFSQSGNNIKTAIGKYAASLISEDDFVFIDAGTTTREMINFITEKQAMYVTNGVFHSIELAKRGFRVMLIGGELKSDAKAIIGAEAIINMRKFHFTKGFFGASGVSLERGFTTADINEATIKETALKNTSIKNRYLLCDNSKFGVYSGISFSTASDCIVITDREQTEYEQKGFNIQLILNNIN